MYRKPSRRQFLRSTAMLSAGLGLGLPAFVSVHGQSATPEPTPEAGVSPVVELSGKLRQVHDPVIIKADDGYHAFHTGNGIPSKHSPDMLEWENDFPQSVFIRTPEWALEAIPGSTNIWAPDISYYNGKYHLYYSVSTFGSNRSVIGLATNVTLDRASDDFEWIDHGLVIESHRGDPYNCIDANLVLDADGVPWLSFGSFWTGIKMIRIDFETGKPSADDTTIYDIASRVIPPNAIEAPFIIRKDDYYYLFVSFDSCCRGVDSTYRVMVGRSENVTGPYVDRDGVPMLEGGGTQVTFPTDRWRGPGHNAILQDDGADYIVYHAYEVPHGTPTLHINQLVWDADGWLLPVYPE